MGIADSDATGRRWVIDEMAMFPAGRYDDLTDSSSRGLKYLREQTDEEHQIQIGTVMHKPRPRRLYPC
jgi:hypothetical protein